jgi:hypothetical protein
MRTAHTNHVHTCLCGKSVRGNGGWASHRWACPVYQARLEARVVEWGHVPQTDINVRRAPAWVWNQITHRWVTPEGHRVSQRAPGCRYEVFVPYPINMWLGCLDDSPCALAGHTLAPARSIIV